MQVLKSFIDGQGRRLNPGDPMSEDYDKPTIAHYLRHGMVGEPTATAEAPKASRPRKDPAPQETQVTRPAQAQLAGPNEAQTAGPSETQGDSPNK